MLRFWSILLSVLIVESSYAGSSVDKDMRSGANSSLQVIQASFPDTVRIATDGKQAFTFCPDNTCDLIEGDDGVSAVALHDFFFLFIYYFSDYYVLNDWRSLDHPTEIALAIRGKKEYESCRNRQQLADARCVLLHLSKKDRIAAYAIRYDEGAESRISYDLDLLEMRVP